jgi:hypothetical protein
MVLDTVGGGIDEVDEHSMDFVEVKSGERRLPHGNSSALAKAEVKSMLCNTAKRTNS